MCIRDRSNTLGRNVVFSEYHDSAMCTGSFMLRKDNYKYIAYPGYEPMLFDLDNDRWELHNLASELPDKVKELDDELRKIVDYESVDKYVKDYDRDSFRVWRSEHQRFGTYTEDIAKIYSGYDLIEEVGLTPWTDEDEKALLEWLEESSNF